MSRPSPAPAPPYVHAHVTRGLRPPCRQATPTPPEAKARHSYAPPMRRARLERAPRMPHPCAADAARIRRTLDAHSLPKPRASANLAPLTGRAELARTSPREPRTKAGGYPCGHFQRVLPAAHLGPSGRVLGATWGYRAKRKPKQCQIEAKSSLNQCQVDAKSMPSRCQADAKPKVSQKQVKSKPTRATT